MDGWDYRGQQPKFLYGVQLPRTKPTLHKSITKTSNDEYLCELPSARRRSRLASLSEVNNAQVTFSNASLT